MRTFIPALRRLRLPQFRKHVTPRQVEFLHCFHHIFNGSQRVGLLIGGSSLLSLHGLDSLLLGIEFLCAADRLVNADTIIKPFIILRSADGIGHGEVTGKQTILPRHPFRWQKGLVRRDQRGFVDGPMVELDIVVQRDRPLPALISLHERLETEIRHAIVMGLAGDELSDILRFMRGVDCLRPRQGNGIEFTCCHISPVHRSHRPRHAAMWPAFGYPQTTGSGGVANHCRRSRGA